MPVSVNASGLVGSYAALLEGEVTSFQCNDSIRAISGGDANATATIDTTDPATNATVAVKVLCQAQLS